MGNEQTLLSLTQDASYRQVDSDTQLGDVPSASWMTQTLTDLDRQTIELVLDKLELPDNGDQGRRRAQARREKRRTENRKAIDAYRHINERVVAFHKFDTVAAEQYRKLYIEIAQARRTRALQTLLMTSALAGEGKSISALNLAITCAATWGSAWCFTDRHRLAQTQHT